MTITARDIEVEQSSLYSMLRNVKVADDSALIAFALFKVGAALVAAIDRNTEALERATKNRSDDENS